MIVIFEGLDGVGKTTLCKQLTETYNYNYIKGSYTNSSKEKVDRLLDLLPKLFDNNVYIYDRCTLIDDFVYTQLDDLEPAFKDYFDIIKSILNHCIIIHLTIPEEERNKSFLNRGISNRYRQFYKELGCLVYLFPLSNNLENDIKKIYNIINQCK